MLRLGKFRLFLVWRQNPTFGWNVQMSKSLGTDVFGGVTFGHGFGGSWVSFCCGTGCGEPLLS